MTVVSDGSLRPKADQKGFVAIFGSRLLLDDRSRVSKGLRLRTPLAPSLRGWNWSSERAADLLGVLCRVALPLRSGPSGSVSTEMVQLKVLRNLEVKVTIF